MDTDAHNAPLTDNEDRICTQIASYFHNSLFQANANAHIGGDARDQLDGDSILSQRAFALAYPASVTIDGATLLGFKALSKQINGVDIYVSMEDKHKAYLLVVETARDVFFATKTRSPNPLRWNVKERPQNVAYWSDTLRTVNNSALLCSLCMSICEHFGQIFRHICPHMIKPGSSPKIGVTTVMQADRTTLVCGFIDIKKKHKEYRLGGRLVEAIHALSQHVVGVSFAIEAFRLRHRLSVTISIRYFDDPSTATWTPPCPCPPNLGGNEPHSAHVEKRKRNNTYDSDSDEDARPTRHQRR